MPHDDFSCFRYGHQLIQVAVHTETAAIGPARTVGEKIAARLHLCLYVLSLYLERRFPFFPGGTFLLLPDQGAGPSWQNQLCRSPEGNRKPKPERAVFFQLHPER